MRKRHWPQLLTLILCLFASCDKRLETPINPVPENYRDWAKPIEKPLVYPVPGHSESKRIIYANSFAWKPLVGKDKNGNRTIEYPRGSVVIKEVYKKSGDRFAEEPQLTIMVKDANNEKAQRGWLYYVKNPGQEEPFMIQSKGCIGCHEAANERHPYFDQNREGLFSDFLFVNLAR